MQLDIQTHHLTQIIEILKTYLPKNAKVYAFGSRARNDAKQYSDLDLAIDLGAKIDFQLECNLKVAFEDSLIPYNVDIIDLNSINKSFKNNIEDDLIELNF